MSRVRLAVADDSAFVRKAIQRVMEQESRVLLVGTAASGEELLQNLPLWKPDVVTLDLSMPGMGGLNALERIMAEHPLPVIILSTHSSKDAPLTIEALHRGAVDFIDKQQYSLVDFDALRAVLVERILQAASARPAAKTAPVPAPDVRQGVPSMQAVPVLASVMGEFQILLIGASTGGPPALQQLLEDLGPVLPLPAVVVQHMPSGFTKAFADRLNAHLPFPVREAAHGDLLMPGNVYIAPAGHHLKIQREGERKYLILANYPESHPHKPSVDALFESAAPVYGRRALAVLLTGMGRDGAEGMVHLVRAGAYTLAQDENTCIVYGMPRAAVLAGAVREELPLGRIGSRLLQLMGRSESYGILPSAEVKQ